jgi:transposase
MNDGAPNMLGFDESDLQTDLGRQLWALVKWQAERLAALEKEVAELRVMLARALRNSSTSSKPPSSDIVKPPKPPSSGPGEKRKVGGQPGHVKHSRLAFDAACVTAVYTYTLDSCPHCHGPVELLADKGRVIQQVETVPTPVQIEEHRGLAYWCPRCAKVHYAPLPRTVEKGGLIGPILTAQIAYMKGVLHASFSTIRRYARDVMGLTISRGQLTKLVQKVSEALEEPHAALRELLRSESVLNVDETGHKDNGDLFWTWCFRAADFTVFQVADSRGSQVLVEVLGREFAGILGCDYFSAYRKYMKECDIRVQFCLAHFIREIKFLTTLPDAQAAAYGERLLEGMRRLFHVIHEHDAMQAAAFTAALSDARQAIVQEAQRDVPASKPAQLVAKRLREHGAAYFQFITTPGLEPTNNLAEQAIRFVAIDRHITQGTRGQRGRRWSERIWTVVATCAAQGRSAFDYLVEVVQAHFNGQPIPSLLAHPP